MTSEQRFFAKIAVDANGCWLWTAYCNTLGYGRFGSGAEGGHRSVAAHRWAYERFVGSIPEGLELDHLCRVPRCVNPAHLEAVTHRENILRSPVAPTAQNARKTHCKHGHSLDDAYSLPCRPNSRECRTCRKVSFDRWYRAKRARLAKSAA